WEAVDDEEKLADYRTASRAIEYLEQRPADQPFFLACGFLKPHVPLIAPKKYFELYDAAKMPLPEDFAPLPSGTGPAYRSNFDLFINRQATPELAREALRAYYACVSFTDAQVGRVLAALDRLKLRDDTAIVLFGDHGWHLGEKGMWSKMSLFEASTRVPMMVSAPGMARGKGCARTVELIDLYPTLSDLCGLRAPQNLEGRSLRPLLDNPSAAWDKPAYTFITRAKVNGATVRDERYRYTEWEAGREGRELYDHSNDPMESRNLADQPAHAATVARMQSLLRKG
nr:sulfatase [Bryobacter sp.]